MVYVDGTSASGRSAISLRKIARTLWWRVGCSGAPAVIWDKTATSALYLRPHGKPALATDTGRAALRFNVSHSHGLALYAITGGREV